MVRQVTDPAEEGPRVKRLDVEDIFFDIVGLVDDDDKPDPPPGGRSPPSAVNVPINLVSYKIGAAKRKLARRA